MSIVKVGVPQRHLGSPVLQEPVDLVVVRVAESDEVPNRLFSDPLIASVVQVVVGSVADQAFFGHARELPSNPRVVPVRRFEVFVVGDKPERVEPLLKRRSSRRGDHEFGVKALLRSE